MIHESTSCHEAALQGRLDFINAGTGKAYLNIYSGTRPASPDTEVNNLLLVSIPLDTIAGSISDGVLTLNFVPTIVVTASGKASWGRLFNKSQKPVFDLDIGAIGTVADCYLNDVALYAGGNVTVISSELR